MTKNKIRLIKIQTENNSKQIEEEKLFSTTDGIIEPESDFDSLLNAYESSSILSGIIKKIANAGNIAFIEHKNPTIQNFLQNLDLVNIFSNLLIFGNAFFERLKDGKSQLTLDLKPILTTTIRFGSELKNDKEYFVQRSEIGLEKVFFSKDEVLFIKNNSISDKYYGESIFSTCLDEIILLTYITKYYKRFFKHGNIEPSVLFDENGTLTDEQIDKIENLLNDRVSGIDNSHKNIFISAKIGKIDLTTKINPDEFISLKRELKEDIAIATNFPFSLLSPEDSNRSTAQTDTNNLYSDIIMPLHKNFLRQLKFQLKLWKIEGVTDEEIDEIEFEVMSLKDGMEEMQILTGYKKSGILNANEVRIKANLGDEVEGLDEYIISENKEAKTEENSLFKVKESIKKMYESKNNN